MFRIDREVKAGNKTISLHIFSSIIKQDLADDIWHGHNYLVHFHVDRTGGGEYYGGGHATDDMERLSKWETFKDKLDPILKHYTPGYEIEEYGQICLF